MRSLRRNPFTAFLLVASIGLALAFMLLLDSTRPSSEGQRTAISEVQRLATERQIERATILDYDDRVVCHLRDGRTLWATYPSSDGQAGDLLATLERAETLTDVDPQTGKDLRRVVVQFLIPILLLVCLFALFTRVGQGADGGSGVAAFSRWRGRARRDGRPLSFADVAGAPEAVTELREICDFLADPDRYAALGARAPKGVLLVGPPGTGKTLLARATAGEADATFLSMSGSEFVESLVGVGAARVRDVFEQARRRAPAIVFIDELDAAGRKRGAGVGQGNDEREQTLNQLLVEMDGFEGDAGIVVLAATNRPDILDPALLRPGRFDRRVTVDVPDLDGRGEILGLHLRDRPVSADVEIAEVARLCPGFTGADLANVANEAALLAVRMGHSEITREDLEEGIERVAAGPERRSHVLSADERWAIAVHEASHAVVARTTGQAGGGQKLSIVARGRQMGTAATLLVDRDRVVLGEADLLRQLDTVMAGAAGERRAFGEHSTTVHDDLHAATQLARSMVTSFGMSALGPVTIGDRQGDVFLGASLQELGSVGPRTLESIDEEVRRLVEEAEGRALGVLERHWTAVEAVAEALVERETLSGPELEALLAGVGPEGNGKPAV